jgi:hypothetical protein
MNYDSLPTQFADEPLSIPVVYALSNFNAIALQF